MKNVQEQNEANPLVLKPDIITKIREMIEDTEGAIQNESIWAAGASNKEQARMHDENKQKCEERVENLKIILKALKGVSNHTKTSLKDAIESVLKEEKLADTEYVEMFTKLKEQWTI